MQLRDKPRRPRSSSRRLKTVRDPNYKRDPRERFSRQDSLPNVTKDVYRATCNF